jgi:NhaP-type Na+/H+ and K+/H+ antiporter
MDGIPLTADPLMMTDLEEREGMAVIGHRTTCRQLEPADVVTFGAFQFAGHVPVGEIADFYGLPVAQAEKARPVGDFVADRLAAKPAVGDSIGIGMIGLVVHDVSGERITRVGLEF